MAESIAIWFGPVNSELCNAQQEVNVACVLNPKGDVHKLCRLWRDSFTLIKSNKWLCDACSLSFLVFLPLGFVCFPSVKTCFDGGSGGSGEG